MRKEELLASLPVGDLGLPLYFRESMSSTNDLAKELAETGAEHGTLVMAEEQTAGRGRFMRSWSTKAGTGLAMSLVLRPDASTSNEISRLTGIGALAVAEAVAGYGGDIKIKWPNDLLLGGRKVGGILNELSWVEGNLDYAVLGIGLNVHRGSVPPESELSFPATCLEQELGWTPSRQQLVLDVLAGVDHWLARLSSPGFLMTWESRLAFRGQRLRAETRDGIVEGTLKGLDPEGRMLLVGEEGQSLAVGDEVLQVRPVDS